MRRNRNRGSAHAKTHMARYDPINSLLTALADLQAVWGMTDSQLCHAAGLPFGTIGNLRRGKIVDWELEKLLLYLERR